MCYGKLDIVHSLLSVCSLKYRCMCVCSRELTLGTARIRLATQDTALACRMSERKPVTIPPAYEEVGEKGRGQREKGEGERVGGRREGGREEGREGGSQM